MSAFLVERYLPPAAANSLAESVTRLAKICAASDLQVRYLQAAHLRGDDTCFCLFEAPSSEAVRRVNVAADFPLDRITEALLLDCAVPGPNADSP
jgi:hypothetical protein